MQVDSSAVKRYVTQLAIPGAMVSSACEYFRLKILIKADTWFCFLIKQVFRNNDHEAASYTWQYLRVFAKWSFEHQTHVLVCFDAAPDFPTRLLQAFTAKHAVLALGGPYAIHVAIIEEVMSLFNRSVWSLRDMVRDIELVTNCKS